MAEAASAGAAQRTFFGQPRALAYLAFTEAWERFSFYGMTSILVLYLGEALFTPARIDGIAGFAAFRHALESVFGPLSTLALASQVYGLYTSMVYFTPLLGGWLADRWLGRRRAVLAGALLMSCGHLAMAFDASFLLALALLVCGCGLLKGNISAQVGGLYPPGDGAGRTAGFAIFSMGINVGAMTGPLVVGLLADRLGWHVGFAAAGAMMLLALAVYLAGYRHLPREAIGRDARPGAPARVAPGAAAGAVPAAVAGEWQTVAALCGVMLLTICHSIAFYQNSNMAFVWTRDNVDLDVAGFRVPVAWFQSIDPLVSIVCVPPLFALWKWLERRGFAQDELLRIGQGAMLAALANALLALAAQRGGTVPLVVPVLYDVLLGVSFLFYWPTLLALVSRAAPARLTATLMGAAFLSLFVSYFLIGVIGGWYERLGAARFWWLHAAIAAGGALLVLVLRRPLVHILARQVAPQPGASMP